MILTRDLLLRAMHTFWQAFVAVIGSVWVASALNVSQINDMDSAKKFALGAVAAVGAAALSALKTTIKALVDGSASDHSDTVAAVYAALDDPAPPAV